MLATGLLTSGTAAAAPASTDGATSGTCSMVMPARLTIRAAVTNVKIPLAANCRSAGLSWATWDGSTRGSTYGEYLWFDDTTYSDILTMYALITPVGPTTWVGTDAYDQNGVRIAQTTATSYTKYGSSATLTGGHQGTKTALVATVGYYNPKVNAYVRWPGKQVLLQYKEIGSSTWKGLKYVTTNKSGQAAYTYYPGKVRQYRVYVPQNATLWDFYSAVLSR